MPPLPGNQHVLDIFPERTVLLEVDYRRRLAALFVGDELNSGQGLSSPSVVWNLFPP